MPVVSQMLRTYARERGLRLEIVEKDYALSYLLAAIAATTGLGGQIVLKGGTALYGSNRLGCQQPQNPRNAGLYYSLPLQRYSTLPSALPGKVCLGAPPSLGSGGRLSRYCWSRDGASG